MRDNTHDHGKQPIDGLMTKWNLTNHHLVEASVTQLNHKQVQKARKGRQLSLHLMLKLTESLNDAILAMLSKDARTAFIPYGYRRLFKYAKGHEPGWADPNEGLM